MNEFEFAKGEIKEVFKVLPSIREKREVSAYKTLISTLERLVSSIRHVKLKDSDITFFNEILMKMETELSSLGEALKLERLRGSYKEHHDYTVAYEKLLRINKDLKHSTTPFPNMINVVYNRATDLGYRGTTEEVLSQIIKEFKQLSDEKERLMFAEKIAGKMHMGNFMISAQ